MFRVGLITVVLAALSVAAATAHATDPAPANQSATIMGPSNPATG